MFKYKLFNPVIHGTRNNTCCKTIIRVYPPTLYFANCVRYFSGSDFNKFIQNFFQVLRIIIFSKAIKINADFNKPVSKSPNKQVFLISRKKLQMSRYVIPSLNFWISKWRAVTIFALLHKKL